MDEKRFIARIILIKAVKKSFIKVSSEYGRRYPVLKYPIFVLNILASVLINFYIRLVTFFHKVRIGYGRNREVFARVVAIMIAATFIVSGVDGVYNGVAHGIGAASGQAVEVGSGMDEDTDEGDKLQDETDDSDSDVSDDSSENDADDESAQDSGDAGEADDEEGGEAVKIDESEAGFVASSYVKNEGVTVTVIADKNVFPANCSLSVRTVTRQEGATVDEAVDEKRDDDRNFVSSYTYDIKIIDSEGNEIEPDTDKGKVRVIFEIDEVKNDNLKADIYHIKNEDDDLRAEKLETEKGLYENKEVAAAETDGFSYYTVEFTYGRKQYVMEGDTEVLLSDILDEVGLSGEVSDARVSDDTLFSAFKDGGVWKVQALQAFDTEETLTVLIDGVEYVIEVTDDPGNQQSGYKVLLWLAENDSTGITTYSNAVTDIFASAGVTVKEVKKNVITAEDIADVQMVYMLMWRSTISVNDNKELLKGFVNKGGRIVMNGENPGCAPDGNRCFSSLAAELGAGFEIQSKYEITGNPVILNTASSLVDNAEGAAPVAAAHIKTFGDAVWVAKVKGNKNDGSDDVVFIADQKAGKGYITVFSDVNFFHHSTIQPAGAAILNNLLTDSVKNIEKVNANPHIETDNITILSATSRAYHRLLDENGSPLTKDNTGISAFDKDGNDVSIHIDNNGWIQGVGSGEETDILNIRGLTHDTPYVLQTVSDEGYISGDPEFYKTEKNIRTLVDTLDPRMADGTKTSKEADIVGYNRIYRNDNSSDKDTITITSIAHHNEYNYGLKTLGGKVITGYVEPTVEGGATYGTVQFTDLDLYTTYYLVAKRKDGKNDNSSEIVIPYVGFEKEWIYDGTEQSLTPTDYRVNEETSELTNGADYEMVTPDIAVNRADPYEQLFPDNELTATAIGSYKFTLKYKAGSDYATSGYVTRSWKIQQLPPAQGGNVSPPVQPSKPDPSPTPVAPTSSSTHVVLSNGKFIKSVSAPGLSGYTDEQQGQKIEVKLTVKEENEKDIDKSIVKKLNESVKSEYSNVVYKGKVHVEYTDMTVTRKIDDGEPEIIPDVNRVLEIEVDCDLEGKYEPVVVREHGGEISAFKKLDEKPTDEFEDGSYFVDAKNNKIWVYARFFSKYSIAYLTKSQVVSVNPKTTATPKPSDSNKSNDSGGSGSGKVSGDTHEGWQAVRNPDGTYTYVKKGYDPSQPKTGDDAIPIIWIWMLMLGTGVVMMSYLVSKKIRKDEEK